MSLKHLINFWKTLEILLINCEIILILTWSEKCVLPNDTKATKVYVLVVTLLTQENAKLLQQLNSGFKRTINWNKYQSKVSIHAPSPYLDFLIDPSFQGVNKTFGLSFEI